LVARTTSKLEKVAAIAKAEFEKAGHGDGLEVVIITEDLSSHGAAVKLFERTKVGIYWFSIY